MYQASLETRECLAKASPDSAEPARDLASSLFRMGQVCQSLGREDEAVGYLRRLYAHLSEMDRKDQEMGPELRQLYAKLSEAFGGEAG